MLAGKGLPAVADYPQDFLDLLGSITAKRAKTVIDHILKHGHVTTEELQNLYGYEHPPRAARDVREQGVPLDTFRVTDSKGRSIGAYRFGDLAAVRQGVLAGRKVFSKEFKQSLVDRYGSRCGVCLTEMEARYLQVDHRVPYQVAGDDANASRDITEYMLICGSCNRAKSWSCEHCENWLVHHKPEVCKTCYWAVPESYKHVAMQDERRLDLTWGHDEVAGYDEIAKAAKTAGVTVGDFVKALLKAAGERKQ
jgi:hypothetical protein